MPGFYADGEYDMAGFIVGIVDGRHILDSSTVREGDLLVGLASDGLHTNGYSLARKIFFDVMGLQWDDSVDHLQGTVADELLKIHRCYLDPVWPLVEKSRVSGLAHITGGGLTDNVPRVLPEGMKAVIKVGAWDIPPIFRILSQQGQVPDDDMWRTFNMGVGMVLIVRPKDLEGVLEHLRGAGCPGFPMGHIVKGERSVEYDFPPEGYPTGL
jgi:phosphoribosylformylglycinamidine cyclo-ligase